MPAPSQFILQQLKLAEVEKKYKVGSILDRIDQDHYQENLRALFDHFQSVSLDMMSMALAEQSIDDYDESQSSSPSGTVKQANPIPLAILRARVLFEMLGDLEQYIDLVVKPNNPEAARELRQAIFGEI